MDLRYREGLSRADIAARLGLRQESVKSLLQRARRALGDCIRRRLGPDAGPDRGARGGDTR